MLRHLLCALACCLLATSTFAAPAPYFIWQGTDKTLCAQTSPGYGWTRMSGPFVRSDCSF